MPRIRVSTTVDEDLLKSARSAREGTPDSALLDEPEAMLRETLEISAVPPAPIPLVREIITRDHLR